MNEITSIVVVLALTAILSVVPAIIADNKGYSFGLWWLYGFFLFPLAFFHSISLRDKKFDEMLLKEINDIKNKLD